MKAAAYLCIWTGLSLGNSPALMASDLSEGTFSVKIHESWKEDRVKISFIITAAEGRFLKLSDKWNMIVHRQWYEEITQKKFYRQKDFDPVNSAWHVTSDGPVFQDWGRFGYELEVETCRKDRSDCKQAILKSSYHWEKSLDSGKHS